MHKIMLISVLLTAILCTPVCKNMVKTMHGVVLTSQAWKQ